MKDRIFIILKSGERITVHVKNGRDEMPKLWAAIKEALSKTALGIPWVDWKDGDVVKLVLRCDEVAALGLDA